MNDHSNNFKCIHLLQLVKKTIEAFDMIQKDDAILIGVSGGPDSVALLHVLRFLSSELSFSIGVAHLNHCLRGTNSDNDAKFVLSLSQKLDIPCYTAKEDVRKFKKQQGLSLEEAARHLRYEFYYTTAKTNGFNKIALGHHQDDNAELILMHLLRGSGPQGLSGIPPVRIHIDGSIKIIRPFVDLSRSQLIDFIMKNNFDYVIDASNQDLSHLRNNIRKNLLPLLKEAYNPNIIATLNRLSTIIRSEEKWKDKIIEPLFERQVTRVKENRISFCVSDFNELPEAVQRQMIRKAIVEIKGNIRRVTLTHVHSIIALSKNGPTHSSLDLPDRLRILKNNNRLMIFQANKPLRETAPVKKTPVPKSYAYTISDPGEISDAYTHQVNQEKPFQNRSTASLFVKEINARLEFAKVQPPYQEDIKETGPYSAYFDYDKLCFPLTLRNVLPGDRFTPLGMTGTQKLKKYFIDHKISSNARVDIPVLLSAEKIIWVVGHRIDDAFKVISTTQNVLKAELLLA